MKNDIKKEQAITLIALVITIIVLLILAGISIATITGQNGILSKSSTTKEETAIRGYEEQLNLIWQGAKVENVDTNLPYEELLKQCKNKIEKDNNFKGATVEIIDDIIEVVTKEGYIFQIIDGKATYVRKQGEELGEITVTIRSKRSAK